MDVLEDALSSRGVLTGKDVFMMSSTTVSLAGRRILVVEDEYLIADDLSVGLERTGAEVIGPVGTLREAQAALASAGLQGAIVDIDLRGEASFPLLDSLIAKGIPTVLVTGYDYADIPPAYRTLAMLQKPVGSASIAAACAALPLLAAGKPRADASQSRSSCV